MKISSFFLLLSSAALVTGCSGGGTAGSSILNPAPVQAQSGYSVASVTGNYSLNLFEGSGTSIFTSAGSIVADGAGNITSGTITEYATGTNNTCTETVTGTYTLATNSTGTANLITKASGTKPCLGVGAIQFAVLAGQSGQTLLLTESDGTAIASGTAVKQ